MDLLAFAGTPSGRFVKTIGGASAFVPAPLAPPIDLNAIGSSLYAASAAIGELKGACRRLRDPSILVAPLQRREALTSSAMEGTFSTMDALVLSQRGIERENDDQTREVGNYVRALDSSILALDRLPICHRIITDAHRTLLGGLSHNRGAQKRPGEYKPDQNWIGGRTIETARFVPPPPAETRVCMDELERFINREGKRYPLLDMALVHYQFETVHPFMDGNGRVGRMLISLMAVADGLLDMPALYVSPVIERRKDDYIDLMFGVSARGEWNAWIEFFLDCVVESCKDTIATIDRLIALHDDYRHRASGAMRSPNALTLVDHLFEQPAMTVNDAAGILGVTYAAARTTIDRLIALDILSQYENVYPAVFIARGILDAASPQD